MKIMTARELSAQNQRLLVLPIDSAYRGNPDEDSIPGDLEVLIPRHNAQPGDEFHALVLHPFSDGRALLNCSDAGHAFLSEEHVCTQSIPLVNIEGLASKDDGYRQERRFVVFERADVQRLADVLLKLL